MTCVSPQVLERTAPETGRIPKLTLDGLTSLIAFPKLLRQWRRRVLERQHLAELDDHVLADFGLTRKQVIDEAAKPFWRPLDPGSRR
jgi:uncharacterized protein YjiS (DUF1127 family)